MPPGPVAVMVYVVVSAGEIAVEPFKSTTPISGDISQVSARVELQDRVVDSPA